MRVELLAVTQYLRGAGTPEELIEHAGRVCYRSASRGDAGAFIRARLRDGHESIIEHAAATFELSGISRACSHQLVRHRLASYSQESQRYTVMDAPEWVVPEAIAGDPEASRIWEEFATQVQEAYRGLRERGVRKEDARFVLPNATATRLVVTMNFRELLHFFRVHPQCAMGDSQRGGGVFCFVEIQFFAQREPEMRPGCHGPWSAVSKVTWLV